MVSEKMVVIPYDDMVMVLARAFGSQMDSKTFSPRDIIDAIDQIPKLLHEDVVHCCECRKYHKQTGWCDEHSCFVTSDGEFCHPWESASRKMFDEDFFCGSAVKGEPQEE